MYNLLIAILANLFCCFLSFDKAAATRRHKIRTSAKNFIVCKRIAVIRCFFFYVCNPKRVIECNPLARINGIDWLIIKNVYSWNAPQCPLYIWASNVNNCWLINSLFICWLLHSADCVLTVRYWKRHRLVCGNNGSIKIDNSF